MRVLAEHPSDLVRDQYLLMVADRLRLEVNALRPRVLELARGGGGQPTEYVRPARRATEAMPRPGLEALRLQLFFPNDVRDRFIPAYFVHDVQRAIFVGLSSGKPVSQVIDDFVASGDEEAASILSELAVDELDREYNETDITAVVAQLLRAAVAAALKDVERDLRQGAIAPDVAMATIRDVKQRLDLFAGPQSAQIEADLRQWLMSRSVSVA